MSTTTTDERTAMSAHEIELLEHLLQRERRYRELVARTKAGEWLWGDEAAELAELLAWPPVATFGLQLDDPYPPGVL